MSDESPSPVCFHCGLPLVSEDDFPLLNRLADGRACPVCADRLLACLPSLVRDVASEAERAAQEEPVDDAYPPGEPF